MLAWSNEARTVGGHIQAPDNGQLNTVECLEFILGIPERARLFAFAFQYDLTKILTDCDNETIYKLFRPELRQRKQDPNHRGPRPVYWEDYELNLVGSKFVVKRGKRRRVVWDTFKFFQSRFVDALDKWKVGEVETLERMRAMKERRSEFDKLTRDRILDYCLDECAYMATLARKLIDAHKTADLKLRAYHGAGSTASCILKKFKIDKAVRHGPPSISEPIASSFFGGRFENSIIGIAEGPINGYDISSAYPYQIAFLPCLECGTWEHVQSEKGLEGATTAIVHYGFGKPPSNLAWGPFPFRLDSGSIAFPSTSGGGWVWLSEYAAGAALFPHVRFREAWIYRTECQHRPFADIPHLYLERLRIGKEGPGIVIKLGCNACYGKLAQSLGKDPPFQSWIWAGMTTAGTRAQILGMLGLHQDPSNLLMIATDGIYTREKINGPAPRDTGTMNEHKKPLGGWEEKIVKSGFFVARPGVYFPMSPASDMGNIRARGIGRQNALTAYQTMISAWQEGKQSVNIAKVSRFHGAKSSIGRSGKPGEWKYVRHGMMDDSGRSRYGQWTERPIDLSFNPLPKRERVNPDGKTLRIRTFPKDLESMPYDRSVLSLEGWHLKNATAEILEQPDGTDFADWEEVGE